MNLRYTSDLGIRHSKILVSFAPFARHNRRVTVSIGAFLNAIGILLGGLLGLVLRKPPSLRAQVFLRSALGVATVFFGLRLVYENTGGTFLSILKQLALALAGVVLGFWIGKILRLQKISNRVGRIAGNTIAAAQKNPAPSAAAGFNACAILFCAAPLGTARRGGGRIDRLLLAARGQSRDGRAGDDELRENVPLAGGIVGDTGFCFSGRDHTGLPVFRPAISRSASSG